MVDVDWGTLMIVDKKGWCGLGNTSNCW